MKPHFSEADLLETYYTRPGESMPVMMHLADCDECAARYERLEAKMRGLRSCHRDEKPETFWARQRISIMRRIEAQRQRRATAGRIARVAAAAILVLIVGGLLTWQSNEQPAEVIAVAETAALQQAAPAVVETIPADPWESEALDDYSSMVAWESWVEEGDQSS